MLCHRYHLGSCAAFILLACSATSFGLGEESIGNDPLNGANYKDWPGLIDVINRPARVYRQWVNGNEYFYFRGDTKALNQALQKFADTTGKVKEVIIRPGPANAATFQNGQIEYDWHLHVVGGIARAVMQKDGGENIWPKHPQITVHLGKNIKLNEIKIPKGVTVVQLKTLKQRYTEALKSKSQNVRGWGCGHLARLDPYDTKSMNAVAGQLKDDSAWVRLNAAGALATFGRRAKPLLPTLKKMAETETDRMKSRLAKTIAEIEQGADRSKEAAAHQKTLGAISKRFAQTK